MVTKGQDTQLISRVDGLCGGGNFAVEWVAGLPWSTQSSLRKIQGARNVLALIKITVKLPGFHTRGAGRLIRGNTGTILAILE
jgi:hypothetical protein